MCFEVDEADPVVATGWSVMVKGRAAEITDAAELRRADELPLRFWVHGEKGHWIRVTPIEITGRRIVVGKERPTSPPGRSSRSRS